MRKKFLKNDIMMIWEDGKPTNSNANLDQDRELEVGDIFGWQPNTKWNPVMMKVLSIEFPLTVEEMS